MDLYKQVTKTCISMAVLAGACAVNAQSTVALYGIADASVRCTDGLVASNAAAIGSATAVSSGVNNTSRFGFRGSEELGGGMAALSSHGIDIEYGPSGATTGAYRLDNSVKCSGKFSDFTVRAMHAFCEQAVSSSALSSSGLGMSYQTADVAATLGYAEFKSAANLQLKGYVAGISGKFGNAKASLTYGSHEAEITVTAKTRNSTLGFGRTLPLNASVDLILAYYRVNRTRNTTLVDDGYNRTVTFLEYKLSKRTKLYAELDQANWQTGYVAATLPGTANGMSLGLVHTS